MASDDRATLVAVVPLAAAIALFGVVFGAASRPVFGSGLTLVFSAFVFSGVVQFTVAGLTFGGASSLAILATAALVNARNLALGAVLRPHLRGGPARRAGLSWFLIDETVGLALTRRDQAARTLLIGGVVCYVAWFAGTVVGVVGGGVVPGVAALAAAVFPVLFVALSAMAATSMSLVRRSLGAAAVTVVLALAWPAGRAIAPVIAAIVVALPPERRANSAAAGALHTGSQGGGP